MRFACDAWTFEVRTRFVPNDLWLGCYWRRWEVLQDTCVETDVYICLIPALPIIITWERWLP